LRSSQRSSVARARAGKSNSALSATTFAHQSWRFEVRLNVMRLEGMVAVRFWLRLGFAQAREATSAALRPGTKPRRS
jgi:hypothetical protein